MKGKQATRVLFALIYLGGLASPILRAQIPDNATVYASGLAGPRGLQFGPDGYLYVAEAGTGGTTTTVGTCDQVPAPVGPYQNGKTGRISRIDANGNRTTVASGFPSAMSSLPSGDTDGVASVAFLDGILYAVLAGGGCSHGSADVPNGVVRVDPGTGQWELIANLSDFLAKHPAKYTSAADFEPDGVFYSLRATHHKLITIEPNHGQIFSISGGEIKELIDISASEGHIVPTSVAERHGSLYVGNLGLFPITPQWERILTLSEKDPLSDLEEYWGDKERKGYRIVNSTAGFTAVVAVDFGPDGLLYALELSTQPGNPVPGTGKVVRVKQSGEIEDVVTGLAVPTGMTFGPDGDLYVSNLGAAPGNAGQILRITLTPGW